MALFTEPIETEQLWSRKVMGELWACQDELDPALVTKLTSLYKNKQKDSLVGKTTIKYKLGSQKDDAIAGKMGFGRLTSQGFETFECEARGSLCGDYYHDIDVVNCHPTIMYQFSQKLFGDTMEECKKFCENRNEYYKEIADSKEDAKTGIFRVLYGGASPLPKLMPFKQEADILAHKLSKHTDYVKLFEALKKAGKSNIFGSFLSYILQTEERKIMLTMRDFFRSEGWSVDVLCYDGIMVRKRNGFFIDTTLLERCKAAVLEKTTYSIQLSEKPFSKYTLPDVEEDKKILPASLLINDSYAAEKLAKIAGPTLLQSNGDIYCCLDGVWKTGESAIRSLIHLHQKQLVFRQMGPLGVKIYDYGGNERNIPSVLKQLTHYAKSGKQPIQFSYSLVTSDSAIGAVDRFLELVNLWTRNDAILTEYVLNWFAHMIQRPTENPGVMLIVTGKKGCGKDTLASFIQEYVIGPTYSSCYNKTQQFFDFYDSKKNKVFIRLEEANRMECIKNQDTLKSWVTSDSIEINAKHKEKITVPNYLRFIFTTNKGNPVAFTDNERRFVILPCSDEKVGKSDFWVETRKLLFNDEAGKAVGEYLEQRDLTSFNVRQYPTNQYQEDVIECEKSSEELFIQNWDGEEVTAAALFELYRDYCSANSLPFVQSSKGFANKLLNFLRDGLVEKKRKKDGVYYEKP